MTTIRDRFADALDRIRWEINYLLHPLTWRLRRLLHPEERRRWKWAGELAGRNYSFVIWYEPEQYSDGRGSWFASVDEYPDQFTTGDTADKAKEKALDLLQDLICVDLADGNPIPEPQGTGVTVTMQGCYPLRFAYLHEEEQA